MKEEKSVAKFRVNLMSKKSKNFKRTLIRKFIIGLSILFFILSGIITVKALRIRVKNDDLKYSQGINSKAGLPGEDQQKSHLSATDTIEKGLVSVMRDPEQEDMNIDNSIKSSGTIIENDLKASQKIYTIQTGSYLEIELAQKQFDSAVQVLNEKELDYLRIEKVGKYYTVRLGKFLDYASAEGFLQALEPQLAESVVLRANIKDGRIIRIYEVGERSSL